MKGRKLTVTVFVGIILTCCVLSALLSSGDEPDESEQPILVATREQENEATATQRGTVASQATATSIPQIKINVSSANIRSGPGTAYSSIQFALQDDTFEVIASNNAKDWYIIALDNGEFGWVANSVFDAVDSLTAVEIAETIPAPPVDQPTSLPQLQTTQPPTLQPTFTSAPPPTAPPPSPICDCSGDLYNCNSFGSHNQAQACFNYCIEQGRGDIHRLDRDNDGLVCEG